LEFVDEEFPSPEEPIIVHKYYKCRRMKEIIFTLDELKKMYKSCSFRKERTKKGIISEFESEVRMINVIFTQLLGERKLVKVMKIDTRTIVELSTPCFSEKDFFVKIGYIYNVLDIDVKVLRRLVSEYREDWKGIKLVEQFLRERGLLDEVKDVIEFWRDLVRLRDCSYPYHRASDRRVLEIMNRLGLKYPPAKWEDLYSSLLQKFVSSLGEFKRMLLKVLE